jgi:hypothetical protein
MTLHAAGRALVLVLLGVFLRSIGKSQTNWTFEDTVCARRGGVVGAVVDVVLDGSGEDSFADLAAAIGI